MERVQLVVFRLGSEEYGVDIHQVREIIRVPSITRVPRAKDFIEGIFNLRGGVIPVLNLRRRLGFADVDVSEDERVVVAEIGEHIVGMRVDGVSEVLGVERSQVAPPSPYIVSVDSEYISGIVKLDDRLIILLDLDRVLSVEELSHVGEVVDASAAEDVDDRETVSG